MSRSCSRKSFFIVAVFAGMVVFPGLSQAQGTVHEESTAVLSGKVAIIRADGRQADNNGNVVVFLDGVKVDSVTALQTASISQKGARFSPRVLPVVSGSTIRFVNDDDIFHNVFSLSRAANFDLGIYPKGTYKEVEVDKSGLINVYCNIHPDMISRVLVLNNPWFTTTAADGSFRIDAIPPGEYTLRLWHELGGDTVRTVRLQAGATHTESLTISNTVTSLSHKNKFGKPYREKY